MTFLKASPCLWTWILMWKMLLLISKLTAAFSRIAFLYIRHQEIQFPGRDQPHISISAFYWLLPSVALNRNLFIGHSWVPSLHSALWDTEQFHTHCFAWAWHWPWWENGKTIQKWCGNLRLEECEIWITRPIPLLYRWSPMTLSELPKITELFGDTSWAAKFVYHNKELVGEKVIQIVVERKFSSMEKKII